MADTTDSPSKAGWTDAEKIAFLIEIATQHNGPDWKTLKLPAGRSEKACKHMWGRMKEMATGASKADNNTTAFGTPTKAKATTAVKRPKEATPKSKTTPVSNKKRKIATDEGEDGQAVRVKGEDDDY